MTGGARGLGRAIAEASATAGATVAVSARPARGCPQGGRGDRRTGRSRNAGGLGRCVGGIRGRGDGRRVLDSFGRIDILVNNAGINIRGPIEQLGKSDWDAVLDTNLKGPWLCCRAVAGPMKHQKWGRVIDVSSMLGEISLPGRTPYASSKGGLTLLTKTLRAGVGEDGINVNALCPGPFATEINAHPHERPGRQGPDGSRRPARPLGRSERAGPRRRLPGLRRIELHDRPTLFVDGGYTAW